MAESHNKIFVADTRTPMLNNIDEERAQLRNHVRTNEISKQDKKHGTNKFLDNDRAPGRNLKYTRLVYLRSRTGALSSSPSNFSISFLATNLYRTRNN